MRLSVGSKLGPFGTAQRQQHAVELEAEVVVQAAGPVLLDHERTAAGVGAAALAARLAA